MANPAQRYQGEMHDRLQFYATWLPGDLMELGDVGVFKNGRFLRQATLKELGIEQVASAPGSPQNMVYSSTSGINLAVESSTTAGPAAASIKVDFTEQGAFLFHATNVRQERLDQRLALATAILKAYDNGDGPWQRDWYLVDSLHTADCATIIVSEDSAAGISFKAKATGALGPVPLADPQASISISSSSGHMVQVVASQGLRPLYTCIHVRDPWWSWDDPVVTSESIKSAIKEKGEPFAHPDIGVLLNS